MDESTQHASSMHGIDLAKEADFDLGSLRIRPAKCEVEWNGASEILQRRVMQVLVALAHARGSIVSQDDLVRRCWRGLSVTDDAIFRCISKLRKLAASYADAPYTIETLQGVGYRLTSSGFAAGDDVADRPVHKARWIPAGSLMAAAAVAAAIVVAGFIWIGNGAVPAEHRVSRISVQPFETLTNSADTGSLARRVPNEIVNELGDSQIEAVLAGGDAADKARPGFVVTGIVRNDSTSASVDVRIEDGITREALWSAEFKRDSRQASDLPTEIAARVADIVNIAIFARAGDPPLADNSALSAVLQIHDLIRDPPEGAWAQMIQRGQNLVADHPDFAFGHSDLGEAYVEAAESIHGADRVQAMKDAARREANLTLRLDPQDAGAYAVLSELEPRYSYRAREAILLRGIKVARHPKEPLGALYKYEGALLDDVGRLNDALTFQLVAQATDEWGAPKTAKLAFAYANIGNLPAARAWLQKAVQRWPNHSAVLDVRKYIAGFYEGPSDALAFFKAADEQTPRDESNAIWRSFVEAKAARSEQATAAAMKSIREGTDEGKISRETEVMMLAALGQTKQAIEMANAAIDHQQLAPWIFFTPVTQNLRQDPQFVSLASRIGLVKYWHDSGKRPDFCNGRGSGCSPQLMAALRSG